MRTLCLALLLSAASQAATIIPVVTASTPSFTITGGGKETDAESATVIIGPGGATLNFTVTLEVGLVSWSDPAPSRFIGEDFADVHGFFNGDSYIQLDYDQTGLQFLGGCQQVFCTGTSPTYTFPAKAAGAYTMFADVETSIFQAPNPSDAHGVVSPGRASFSITLLSGDVYVAPEPRTWLLSGFGLLLALAHRVRSHRAPA